MSADVFTPSLCNAAHSALFASVPNSAWREFWNWLIASKFSSTCAVVSPEERWPVLPLPVGAAFVDFFAFVGAKASPLPPRLLLARIARQSGLCSFQASAVVANR